MEGGAKIHQTLFSWIFLSLWYWLALPEQDVKQIIAVTDRYEPFQAKRGRRGSCVTFCFSVATIIRVARLQNKVGMKGFFEARVFSR